MTCLFGNRCGDHTGKPNKTDSISLTSAGVTYNNGKESSALLYTDRQEYLL